VIQDHGLAGRDPALRPREAHDGPVAGRGAPWALHCASAGPAAGAPAHTIASSSTASTRRSASVPTHTVPPGTSTCVT
jgi:hypothetical protein